MSEAATKPWPLFLLLLSLLFGTFVGGLMTWHHETQLYGGAEHQGQIGVIDHAFHILQLLLMLDLAFYLQRLRKGPAATDR